MPNPSKSLLYSEVFKKLENLSFKSTLDLACGPMMMRSKIKTDKYLGVDIDINNLKFGAKSNPGVRYKNCSIESLVVKKKFDLVICLQTIGINSRFNIKNLDRVIKRIVNYVSSGGYLIINFGPMIPALDIRRYKKKYFLNYFLIKQELNYGIFDYKVNNFFHKIIFLIIKNFKFINFLGRRKYVLFFCKKK
jgi:2-polyprenyl-3-methyl-5-hydroxy-6-metoxy-1,4-benzoquinol methylase